MDCRSSKRFSLKPGIPNILSRGDKRSIVSDFRKWYIAKASNITYRSVPLDTIIMEVRSREGHSLTYRSENFCVRSVLEAPEDGDRGSGGC